MVYFFYGENTYLLDQKVREIEANFIAENGSDFNVSKVAGAKLTKNDFIGLVSTVSFLGNGRLIVIKNLLLENGDKELQSYIAANIEKMPGDTTVIFVEAGLPDGRSGLFKKLKSIKNVFFSEPLAGLRLNNWVKDQAQLAGCSITNEANGKLILFVGSDLWRLENEIIKLALYSKSKDRTSIEAKDVELLVEADSGLSIFELTDALAAKDRKRAIIALTEFLKRGEDEFFIFNMIVGHFRKMLIINDLKEHNFPLEKSALHPFVIKKMTASLRYFRKNELLKIYFRLQNIDAKLKNGMAEGKTALCQFVVDFCKI